MTIATSAAVSSSMSSPTIASSSVAAAAPFYTTEQRRRRDGSRWTLVQGILAPVQFLAFAVSLALVTRSLLWGTGVGAALASVVVKTLALYAIMITGALWEKDVFGRYLFAPLFFWEDVVSMGVIALHTAYLAGLAAGFAPRPLLWLAVAAYATYVVNAAQFVRKFRLARQGASRDDGARATASRVPATGAAPEPAR